MPAQGPRLVQPAVAVFSAVFSRLGLLLWLILLARFLPPADFGALSAFLVVATMVNAVVSGGGDMWLNSFTSRGPALRRRAPRIWALYLAICAGLGLGILFLLAAVVLVGPAAPEFLAHLEIHARAGAILIAGAVTAGLTEACFALLRASNRVKRFFFLRDIAVPGSLLAVTLLARPDTAVSAALLYLVVHGVALSASGLVLVFTPGLLPPIRFPVKATLRRLTSHTCGMIYGNFSSRLSTYVDIFVLVTVLSLPALGEYRMAAQLAVGFMVVQHFVFLTLTWQLRRSAYGTDEASRAIATDRQRFLLGLSVLAVLVLIPIAPWVMSLMGERFVSAAPVLQIYVLLRFVMLLWGPNHEILVSNGHTGLDANANMAAVVGWVVAFAALALAKVAPVPAAIIAGIAAANLGQAVRYTMMRRNGLRPIFGHRLGGALPILLSLLLAIGTIFYIRGRRRSPAGQCERGGRQQGR